MFPRTKLIKWHMAGEVTLTPTASVNGVFVMNLTSAFDMFNTSGPNQQPRGYDQIMGVWYQKYRVLGGTVKVQTTPVSNVEAKIPGYLVAQISEDGGAISGSVTMVAMRDRVVPGIGMKGFANVDNKVVTRSMKWSSKRWLGARLNDEDFVAEFSANPVGTLVMQIAYISSDNVAIPTQLKFTVTVDYFCMLSDRIGVAES